MSNKTKELIEILIENPDRELIFMYPDEYSDYAYTLGYPDRILLDEYVTIDERVWLRCNENVLFDKVAKNIADSNFTDFPLTDEQEKWINEQTIKYIENLDWKKAIVVYIEP